MSNFETNGNSGEVPSFKRTDSLKDIDTSHIEASYDRIHEIQQIELEENKSNNEILIESEIEEAFDNLNNPNLEKESKTEKIRDLLYLNIGVNENLELNTELNKFKKGLVDGLIVENIELVEELLEKGIDELVELLNKITDIEVIKEIINDFIESFGAILDTFNKPYEGGLAIGATITGPIGKITKGLKIVDKNDGNNEEGEKTTETSSDLDIVGGVETQRLYDRHPNLENYQDVFEPTDEVRLMGEGTKGLVLANQRLDFVGKIPINSEVYPILLGEIKKHERFYNKVKILKENGDIPEWINIPKIRKEIESNNLLLVMDKIDGNSLTTYWYKDYYKGLPGFKNEKLDGMTDYEVKLLLEKKYGVNKGELDSMIMDIEESLEKFFPEKLEGYNKAVEALKKSGIVHEDRHSGNIMIDKKGNLFLIDFDASSFNN